jgi:small subunit ribosomal protein S8
MSVNDPIADMLVRLRNAGMAGQEQVLMPHSLMKGEIARILKREGYILDYTSEKEQSHKVLRLYVKYGANRKPLIRGLRRISKSGLRRYAGTDDIPRVANGMGIAILSTSRGLMTDVEARKSHVGGEVLCYVW